MYASTIVKALVAASANNVAVSQSLAGAGNLLINGSAASGGVAVLDSQREIIITSAGDDTSLTWTVIGTDDTGNPIKDIFAGANGIATSNLNFKTAASIFGSKATASTVTAGTNTIGASPWKIFGDKIATPNLALTASLVGTANYTVEYTQQPFLAPITTTGASSSVANGPATPNPVAFAFTDMTGKSANAQGAETIVFHAWRLKINSGTGVVTCSGRQSGLASP